MGRLHSEVGWPVPFLAAFNFPSVTTRYQFADGWTVGEHPNYDPRVRLEPSMFLVYTYTQYPLLFSYTVNCNRMRPGSFHVQYNTLEKEY